MQSMKKYASALILVLIVLAGAGLRVANLDRTSLWVDEANTVFTAQALNETGVDTLPSGHIYGRARVYTAIVAASFRIFGVSEASARLPSALFGVLSILLVYGLARIFFGPKTAFVTACFMTFSHFEVGWSRTARMYTLLQFMTLWLTFAFLKTFPEADARSPRNRWVDFLSFPWLAVLLVTFAVTAVHIHSLIAMLVPAFGLAMLVRAIRIALNGTERSRWLNAYTVLLVGGVMAGAALLAVLPGLRQTMLESFTYTPGWAEGSAFAARKTALLEFLLSPWRMPITVFAFLGGFQLITRKHVRGWLPGILFLAPFILLSLTFTHRVEAYLFFVYPFFLMIAAFGLVNWLDAEYERLPFIQRIGVQENRLIVIGMVLLMFVLFPWLRITLNIPRTPDGVTNMAVTPVEWRGASRTVLSNKHPDDVVITSLPQVALYYGLESDYMLNQANLEQAESKGLVNAQGQRTDLYAGVRCVESLDMLKSIIAEHASGWLLVSNHHFTHPQYVPEPVREYIEKRFGPPQTTPQGTVRIYRWMDGGTG